MTTILEPSFENWYPTWDIIGDGNNYGGGTQTAYVTDGIRGLYVNTAYGPAPGTFSYAIQSITFDSVFDLLVDFRFYDSTAGHTFRVLVDDTVVYELAADSGIHANVSIHLAYEGVHTLKLGSFHTPADTVGHTAYFDNLRITNETVYSQNTYVNSSTGNDANVGDSCVAGRPVKTFQKAYNILASGGTIHVCNSGADFSAEIVTFTKGFSITVDGNGYCYLPKLS